MKSLTRSVAISALSLFLLDQTVGGVHISGGIFTYILAGVLLSVLNTFLRPLLKLVTLPLNIATLGAFTIIINALILYLLTVLVPQISISPFSFNGVTFAGIIIPKIAFNSLFAHIVSATVLSGILTAIRWLIA